MRRLAFLYPPNGAEFEYYRQGERLADGVRVTLAGVRIFGDEAEHEPEHLRRTAALGNLRTSARALAPLAPVAAVWACTSGSFIDGLAHARAQVRVLASELGCPATSASLAFVAALQRLGIGRVSVLASYPEAATAAFTAFLAEAGIAVDTVRSLGAESGPQAARIDGAAFEEAARTMAPPSGGALLIPDTAVPTLDWLAGLEQGLERTVLSANQVSLWHAARLADIAAQGLGPGRLFAA